MTFSLSKWSALALLSSLALACSDEPTDESEEVVQMRSHPEESLPESNFEIDTDANLVVDDGLPSIDWAAVVPPEEVRQGDLVASSDDDSYTGGAKEDDTCPSVGTGSIPKNKSDLTDFGVYFEGGRFLHLFWRRVQEPTGTTLMDFEFNQKNVEDDCGNGVNTVRTAGDMLIEYRLAQGGTVPAIKARFWSGSAWGPEMDLSAEGAATGSINASDIEDADSDGLGSTGARTFGEASIDLDKLPNVSGCMRFGSALLKSRSSDTFKSALKDFIGPVGVDINTCGGITIRKETRPSGLTEDFDFFSDVATDPSSEQAFTLHDGGEPKEFANVIPGTYTVTEDDMHEPNIKLISVDCGAGEGDVWSFDPGSREVTITITEPGDHVTCTFINERQTGAIKIKKTRSHAADGPGDHPHAGVDFTVSGGGLTSDIMETTDANGEVCIEGLLLSDSYTVTETVPEGYTTPMPKKTGIAVTDAASCPNGVLTSFHNTPLTDITVSVNSQIDGGTASTIQCGPMPPIPIMDPTLTGSNGDGSLTVSNLEPGLYTCTVEIK